MKLTVVVSLVAQIISKLTSATISHVTGISPTAKKWDYRTLVTMTIFRVVFAGTVLQGVTLGQLQDYTTKDKEVRGKMWVAKATIRSPDDNDTDMRESVFEAIEKSNLSTAELKYTKPALAEGGLLVEWTGVRSGVGDKESLPDISEDEKYHGLMTDSARTSKVTILYFHGGAFMMSGLATYRDFVTKIAENAGGRVCNVAYRLAPQHPFPSQLLDGLMVYLSLLYPPTGSMHEAVPVNEIVFAGDSAGANLCFALVQLILQLQRSSSHNSKQATLRFWNRNVTVPLPAGIAVTAPPFDLSTSLPSHKNNADFDYLMPFEKVFPLIAPDAIWPTSPPRADVYCDLGLFDHPLVSPITASSWAGAPPTWISIGQESVADDSLFIAKVMAEEGVIVHLEQFEAMPHGFAIMLQRLAAAKKCIANWGSFCQDCVEKPEALATRAVWVKVDGTQDEIDIAKVTELDHDEVRALMEVGKRRRHEFMEAQKT
ncbi:hypothetical protein LTR37_012632 [Vermiconidia calcicola]|uniref:Uncharacterized protein n=1 Tax=Vermiconidia calcicola TaxID=1690605 RepID=A0ACC3MZ96_9PEZI|nr:hypothetical protein LTR37_012632 [Vermiconidia calcicola]